MKPKKAKIKKISKSLESSNQELSKLSMRFNGFTVHSFFNDSSGIDLIEMAKNNAQFQFKVVCQFGLSRELDLIGLNIGLRMFTDKQKDKILASIQAETFFGILGARELVNENMIVFPQPFLGGLINAALGMTRGVFFAKNAGTPFQNVIPPFFGLDELIPKEPFKVIEEENNTSKVNI